MPSGIIFSSVTSFVLSPGKTKRRVKRDDLDTLSEVWTGPVGAEDGFIPQIGTKHQLYNLMTLIDASTKQLPGLVVEVTLDYHGKLDNTGTSSYTSVPTINRYWTEGELGYQFGAITMARRYTGRCVTITYITNRVPSGNPTNLGLAKEFMGFTNIWDQVVNQGLDAPPGSTITTQMPPIQRITCTDVRTEDSADGWYRVTETYQSRMFPGETITTLVPQRQFPIFLGFKDMSQIPDLFGTPQVSATSQQQANQTEAAAQQAGDNQGVRVPVSPSGTAGQDVAQSTGLDPAWVNASDVNADSNSYGGGVSDLIGTAQAAASTSTPPADVQTGWWELGGDIFPPSRAARLTF